MEFQMKTIPGFFAYRVGNDGSLWSCWENMGFGKTTLTATWHLLQPGPDSRGYRRVNLCGTMGQRRAAKVAHLVLEAFAGPKPNGLVACHRNDCPMDDRLENLRWDTRASNNWDAVRNDRRAHGEKHYRTYLSNAQVQHIRQLRKEGKTYKQIATRMSMPWSTVASIISGGSWKHLS